MNLIDLLPYAIVVLYLIYCNLVVYLSLKKNYAF